MNEQAEIDKARAVRSYGLRTTYDRARFQRDFGGSWFHEHSECEPSTTFPGKRKEFRVVAGIRRSGED